MAKDPAMLWYWADWHSGTTTLSRFLKGCYMDLLHAQFNSGSLSLEEIKTVLGSDFGQAWPTLQKKFTVDPAGKYFNVRLEEEKTKRANYTASRRKNLESTHMNTHMDKHMHKHMENGNRNEIVNEVREGVQGEGADFKDYEQWTADVISGNDWLFADKAKNMNVPIDARLQEFARSHLALLAKYPKMRPPDQNRFRVSLLGFMQEKKIDNQTAKKKFTIEELNAVKK